MYKIIDSIKKELDVNAITIRVLRKLAENTELELVEYVSYRSGRAVNYGIKRAGSKGLRFVGSAKECAEYLASEIIDKEN